MAIPEEQLTTWAQIGAQQTSRDTYATVKLALDDDDAGYHHKNYKIFLQGSYGNDTNIWKESDVDVVIRLDSTFSYDVSAISSDQQQAFHQTLSSATYTRQQFHDDVMAVLNSRFCQDVEPGTKAVKIKARGNRRKVDVLIAIEHRRYTNYDASGGDYVTGISFLKSDGTRVVNYPTKHRENLIAKNQAANEWFKHIVRIYKNARQCMIDQGQIKEGVAPSYYIEGLLYNVPNENFGKSYVNSMVNSINWLVEADQSNLACANMQYWLLRGDANVTWNAKDCNAFLNGLVKLWKDW